MSVALDRPMILDEFLAWEHSQELRWEFDGFAPVAMTGGTAEHSAMQRNLAIEVGGRLRGKRCQFYTADLKVLVAGSIRYPDAFVACTPLPVGTLVVTNPVVIFEVLSPSHREHRYRRQEPGIPRHTLHSALRHAGPGPGPGNRVRAAGR